MSNGMYLGSDYTIHREEGYYAALRYLVKKDEEKLADTTLGVVGWTVASLVVWGITAALIFGF